MVAWISDGQDGDWYGVYAQRFAGDASPWGDEFQLNTYEQGAQSIPTLAPLAEGNHVVVWESHGQVGSSYSIFAQRFNGYGYKLYK